MGSLSWSGCSGVLFAHRYRIAWSVPHPLTWSMQHVARRCHRKAIFRWSSWGENEKTSWHFVYISRSHVFWTYWQKWLGCFAEVAFQNWRRMILEHAFASPKVRKGLKGLKRNEETMGPFINSKWTILHLYRCNWRFNSDLCNIHVSCYVCFSEWYLDNLSRPQAMDGILPTWPNTSGLLKTLPSNLVC